MPGTNGGRRSGSAGILSVASVLSYPRQDYVHTQRYVGGMFWVSMVLQFDQKNPPARGNPPEGVLAAWISLILCRISSDRRGLLPKRSRTSRTDRCAASVLVATSTALPLDERNTSSAPAPP